VEIVEFEIEQKAGGRGRVHLHGEAGDGLAPAAQKLEDAHVERADICAEIQVGKRGATFRRPVDGGVIHPFE